MEKISSFGGESQYHREGRDNNKWVRPAAVLVAALAALGYVFRQEIDYWLLENVQIYDDWQRGVAERLGEAARAARQG